MGRVNVPASRDSVADVDADSTLRWSTMGESARVESECDRLNCNSAKEDGRCLDSRMGDGDEKDVEDTFLVASGAAPCRLINEDGEKCVMLTVRQSRRGEKGLLCKAEDSEHGL